MRTIFDNTLTKDNPAKSVTFVDNHDSQPGQSLESWVQGWFRQLAYALILLRQEGYPCVFYGDWYGIPHDEIPDMRPRLLRCLKPGDAARTAGRTITSTTRTRSAGRARATTGMKIPASPAS